MDTIEVRGVSDLLKVVTDLIRQRHGQWWYRGHACDTWGLVPSVFREHSPEAEQTMIADFMLGAPSRYEGCPNALDVSGAPGDAGRWICLMQHFGLPTRLLDWSRSPLVAAFFALEEVDAGDKDAAIWILDAVGLNQNFYGEAAILMFHNPFATQILRPAFGLAAQECDQVAAVNGPIVDVKMTLQQARYTIHGDGRALESRIEEIGSILKKLIIPQASRASFVNDLWAVGVHRDSIFPDLGSFARALSDTYKNARPFDELRAVDD